MALFSVSSVLAKLEYNWKNHTFYTSSSTEIDQNDYNSCVNEVLGEALLSRDFEMAKESNEVEVIWLIVYGLLKWDGTPVSACVIKDIQSIALSKRRTAKLIAQLEDSYNHRDDKN